MKQYPIGTLLFVQNKDLLLGMVIGHEWKWGSLHHKAYFFERQIEQYFTSNFTSIYVNQYERLIKDES